MRWCIANVPPRFWDLFKAHLDDLNNLHRDAIIAINQSIGQGPGTSLLKHFSYNGAIEIPDTVPDHYIHNTWDFTDPSGRTRRYLDPQNSRYAAVFRWIWPRSLPDLSNFETIGDVVEAFFGYHWTLKYEREVEFTCLIEDFVSLLTMALFSYWALETYFPNWQESSI